MGTHWAPDTFSKRSDERLVEDVDFYQYNLFAFYNQIGVGNMLQVPLPGMLNWTEEKKRELKDLIWRKNKINKGAWGWKHPMTVWYAKDFLVSIMAKQPWWNVDPYWVIVHREQDKILASMELAYGKDQAEFAATGYETLINEFADICPNPVHIKYEHIVANPKLEIIWLDEQLQLRATMKQCEEAVDYVQEFIDAKQKRQDEN